MNQPVHDSCELIAGNSSPISAIVLGGYGPPMPGNRSREFREKGTRR
jgi:hypothetical protein